MLAVPGNGNETGTNEMVYCPNLRIAAVRSCSAHDSHRRSGLSHLFSNSALQAVVRAGGPAALLRASGGEVKALVRRRWENRFQAHPYLAALDCTPHFLTSGPYQGKTSLKRWPSV